MILLIKLRYEHVYICSPTDCKEIVNRAIQTAEAVVIMPLATCVMSTFDWLALT